MEWVKRKIRILKRRNQKLSPWYLENGGKLLEGLIASSNGKSVMRDETGYYISRIFQQRSVLVKKFNLFGIGDKGPSYAVNRIVVNGADELPQKCSKGLGLVLRFGNTCYYL
ncbi:Hypothetical predicted protein [Olea europaea subsp. europaea]|uniref:Uncharacterized protein n=1 Tax=Olea europaea subsp. europaea TaxID=158383 RepID=A0A8S0SPZ3_OLEEU|nr:Hypothetical predicted protein [Olea europaea subsp. europaea]